MPRPGRKKKSGVYQIIFGPTGHVYIGSAKDLGQRKTHHFKSLRNGTNHNKVMQFAWDIFGEEEFSWEILEECPVKNLSDVEFSWMQKSKRPLFNILSDARRPPEMTSKTKAKLSKNAKKQHADGKLGRQTWKTDPAEVSKKAHATRKKNCSYSTPNFEWTPERRAKVSEAMKKRRAEEKVNGLTCPPQDHKWSSKRRDAQSKRMKDQHARGEL